MKSLIAIALLAGLAHAGEVTVAWDANPVPVTDYRVWRGIECLATVTTPQATLTLPDAPCALTVTARNGTLESAHSAPLKLIALTVQQSADLKAWASTRTIHREQADRFFYRLKLEVAP